MQPQPITAMREDAPMQGPVLAIWDCYEYHHRALGFSWSEAFDALKVLAAREHVDSGTVKLYNFAGFVHYELGDGNLYAYQSGDDDGRKLEPTYVGTLEDSYIPEPD